MSNYASAIASSTFSAQTLSDLIEDLYNGTAIWAGTSGGSSNAYTASLTGVSSSYDTGQEVWFVANHNCTGASTFNINSIGATSIKKFGGTTDLTPGDIVTDQLYCLRKMASVWELTNPSGQIVHTRDVSTATLNNTAVETTLFSTTIEAGTLGIHRGLRLTAYGTENNNVGSDQTLTLRVKFGSDTICTAAITISTSASNDVWKLETILFNKASASSQNSVTNIWVMGPSASSSVGTAAAINTSDCYMTIDTGTAEDSSTDKTLSITAQHGAQQANHTTTCLVAFVELL